MHIKLLIKSLEPNTDFLTSKIAFDYIFTVYTSLSDSCLVYRFNFYQDKLKKRQYNSNEKQFESAVKPV